MKNRIRVLFIDDNDLKDEIENISRTLSREGKHLEAYIININEPKYKKSCVEGGDIFLDKALIINDIFEKGYMDQQFDIIACDFNFSDDKLNGYDLLSDFITTAINEKYKIRRARILFYTGKVNDLKNVAVENMKRFLNLKVDSIIDRQQLTSRIVRLSNIIGNEMDLEKIFLDQLEPHKTKIFKNTFPNFSGKTINDVISEIETDSDNGRLFLKSLVEQTAAHMIKLQGK